MRRTVALAALGMLVIASGATAHAGAQVASHRPKRPAAEHVPATVHKASLSHRASPFDPATKRTVTGTRARRLVHDFDALKTEPIDGVHCDIAGGPSDRVVFRTAKHTWVVTEAACTNVVVTRDGKSLPTLIANTAWDKALAADLGT